MTRALTIALVVQAVLIASGLTLAADIYAHKRTEQAGGVNIWGYRGPVARQRQPNEVRIAFIGSTRAFGWGSAASETVPATVRWLIMLQTDAPGRSLRPVVSINLAEPAAAPASYAGRLAHFAYLKPDYVVVYDDLGAEPLASHRSRTFAATGYAPALPLVLTEKGMALAYGSVRAGYDPMLRTETSLVSRVTGHALQAAGSGLAALDRAAALPLEGSYADAIAGVVESARGLGARVVVAFGPAVTEVQASNRDALKARLEPAAGHSVALLDLTTVSGLSEPAMTLDGYNYSSQGRVRVAEAIAPTLLAWIEADDSH